MTVDSNGGRRFEFGTKAETLDRLSRLVRSAVVLPLVSFSAGAWEADPERELRNVLAERWSSALLVVRSSTRSEDLLEYSNAGHYLSRTGVRGPQQLREAIDDVVASFDDDPANQVLVQPQLVDPIASGVVSSCEPSSGAPYRIVNWTDGADTSEVTSGRSAVRTWYFLGGAEVSPPRPWLAAAARLVTELEVLCRALPFEFEFGVTADGTLVLFQLRPLTRRAGAGRARVPRDTQRRVVAECQRQVRLLMDERPPALGPRTVLGVMPDWNPAEMIGTRPRPLALSLYRSLITDRVWAESRVRYGYRDLRGVPLLVDLCGLPYIDTRASFTSLVPAALSDDTARRLVAHYVSTLRANPHLHDKVEFEIALTGYDFTTPGRADSLVERGVLATSESEQLAKALHEITVAMMADDGPYHADRRRIRRLDDWLGPDGVDGAERVRALMRLCRREGTLPFSGLARAAFVGTAIARSLVRLGVLSPEEGDVLMGSSNTTSTAMRQDFAVLDRREFLRRYGHLRPGTYDILSPRYDENPDGYLDWSARPLPPAPLPPFRLSVAQDREIRRLLAGHDLPGGPERLIDFVAGSIGARESGKLRFTRVVSAILVEIGRIGRRLGLSRDDLSYLPVDVFCRLTDDLAVDRGQLADQVRRGRERHWLTESLCAPAVLTEPAELTAFLAMKGEANFVTQARAVGRVADLAAGDDPDGAIAMIPAADPGYDWIFTRGIVGLVTAFGGANSHMAIRAFELGIPAAIGVGEERFKRLVHADALEIDAGGRHVRPVALNGAVTAPVGAR